MPISVNKTIELHHAGWTPQQLAALTGLTPNGVRARLQRHNAYRPRPHGRNSKAQGWHLDGQGYVMEIVYPDWQFCAAMARKCSKSSFQVAQHRKVMADHLGRALTSDETVHHIDGDKTNNSVSNLQLRQGKHGNGVAYVCRCCGSSDVEAQEL